MTTYTYDSLDRVSSKTTHKSNGEFEYIKYLNDNSSLTNVLAEIGSEGNVSAYYTIGADLVSQERDGRTSFYLYDGHGSIVGLANENGAVTDTYVYDAFGNLIDSTGTTENCYRYCGEQFDESTGLYYLRARYMDTVTGRFISQDTYNGDVNEPISLHKYLYANSNPMMYGDPSGYVPVEEKVAETVIVIVVIILPTIGTSFAQAKHDQAVLEIGTTIIRSLKAVEYLLPYAMIWGAAIGAMISNVISGESTSLDTSEEIRDKIINDTLGKTQKDNENHNRTLYHYTNKKGLDGIVISGHINPSIKATNPRDARAGDGSIFRILLKKVPRRVVWDLYLKVFQTNIYILIILK